MNLHYIPCLLILNLLLFTTMMQRYRWRYERYVFRVDYMKNLTLPAKSAKRCCKRACSSECPIREQIESKPLYLEKDYKSILGLSHQFSYFSRKSKSVEVEAMNSNLLLFSLECNLSPSPTGIAFLTFAGI